MAAKWPPPVSLHLWTLLRCMSGLRYFKVFPDEWQWSVLWLYQIQNREGSCSICILDFPLYYRNSLVLVYWNENVSEVRLYGLLERQETTYWPENAGNCQKTQENAGKHPKYIKIWVAEVEGCNLIVYMGFMEVKNDIEVPICRKKNWQNARSFRRIDALAQHKK